MDTLHRAITLTNASVTALCDEMIAANEKLGVNIQMSIEANTQNQNRLQALNVQIIADKTAALASIEKDKLDAIYRANTELYGHF